MQQKPRSDDKSQQRDNMNKKPGQQNEPNLNKQQQQQGSNPQRNPGNPEINRQQQQQQQPGYQPQQGGKTNQAGE